jgi:hypothetical protein
MGKWYGIGFIWFLIRLILTIVFFIIDAVLSLGFLLGQVGFLFFGPTGRNVIYGILVLIVLIPMLIGLAVAIADRLNPLLRELLYAFKGASSVPCVNDHLG